MNQASFSTSLLLFFFQICVESKVQILWVGESNWKEISLFQLLSNVKTRFDIFSIFCGLLRISELYPTLPRDVQSEILNSRKGAKSRQIGPVIISRIFCCKKKEAHQPVRMCLIGFQKPCWYSSNLRGQCSDRYSTTIAALHYYCTVQCKVQVFWKDLKNLKKISYFFWHYWVVTLDWRHFCCYIFWQWWKIKGS